MGCCGSNGLIVAEIKRINNSSQKKLPKKNELTIKNTCNEDNLPKEKLFVKEHNTTKDNENEDKENNKINNVNTTNEIYNEKKQIINLNKELKMEDNKNNKIDEIKIEYNYFEENEIKLDNQKETEKIYVSKKIIMNEKNIYKDIENLKNDGLNKINNDEYPKCIESLNLNDLEKFFTKQSEKLNEIEKSFLIYNWIALNISLDLNENKNVEKL